MGFFDAPSRSMTRDYGDIYREKADRLAAETRLLVEKGRLGDAEERVRELIDLQNKVVGDRHPDYATGLCMLADILTAQDEVADAETLLLRALDVRKKALGERHPDYASCLDQLGRVMLRWEDLGGAEPLLRKALEVRKAALGEGHPDYAASLEALGELLCRQDAAAEAEPLIRDALAIRRNVRGEEHPGVAAGMVRLADVLRRLERFEEAEELLKRAIEVCRQHLGENHREHASALAALANLHQAKGEFDAAEHLLRLLLDMKHQTLGEHHPERLAILSQLGHLSQRRGDLATALDLFQQAVASAKESLGERHPEFANCLTNLGLHLHRTGDLAGAEPVLRQAVAVRKEVLGPRHPDYAASLVNLAQLVQKRGDPTWARMLLRDAVEVRRSVFGEQHPEYANGLSALAEAHSRQGEFSKAEALLKQACEIHSQAQGENHAVLATTLSILAGVLRNRGEFDEAENLLRRALAIRKEALGENHPDYATTLGNLAWLLQKRGDRPGAVQHLSRALEIRRRALGERHPDTLQYLERLKSLRPDMPSPGPGSPATPDEAAQDVAERSPGHDEDRDLQGSALDHAASYGEESEGPQPDDSPADEGAPVDAGNDLDPLQPDDARVCQDSHDGLRGSLTEGADAAGQSLDELVIEAGGFETAPPDSRWPSGRFKKTTVGEGLTSEDDATRKEDSSCVEPVAEEALKASEDLGPPPLDTPVNPADYPACDPYEADNESVLRVATSAPVERDAQRQSREESLAAERGGVEVPASGWGGDERPADSGQVEGAALVGDFPRTPDDVRHVDGRSATEVPGCRVIETPTTPFAASATPGGSCADDAEPARSAFMSESSSHLSQELAGMSARLSELGERLLCAARQLHAPGTPPADDLLEALGGCRGEFFALRDRARGLAATLEVSSPPDEQLQSLQDLNGLLDQVAEAEIRQSRGEEVRRRAQSVLDRVLSLAHVSNPDFEPLRECHERARELHAAVSSAPWSSPHGEAERLAEGEHPFADLITLIQERDELSDELWDTLHQNVGQAFGIPLAAAAVRAKLVITSQDQGAGSRGEMACSGDHA